MLRLITRPFGRLMLGEILREIGAVRGRFWKVDLRLRRGRMSRPYISMQIGLSAGAVYYLKVTDDECREMRALFDRAAAELHRAKSFGQASSVTAISSTGAVSR